MKHLRPLAIAVLACAGLLAPGTAHAATDPGLGQVLEQQTIATDEVVLERGHVDLGPLFVDGEWTLMIHDDTQEASVWRPFATTVLQVSDDAVLTVPDDPAYAFIGEPGRSVHVMPQTQNPDVVWTGWNTQDPTVMDSIDRGVTLGLGRVEGPGDLLVYLQSGSFDAPEVLWDSRSSDEQPIWVDVNTHTHANWVFTEPGVYLVEATVDADLVDGSSVSDTQTIRFAVGDDTNTGDALAAGLSEATPAADADEPTADAAPADPQDGLTVVLVAAIAVVGVALVVALAVAVVRTRRAKARARTARTQA